MHRAPVALPRDLCVPQTAGERETVHLAALRVAREGNGAEKQLQGEADGDPRYLFLLPGPLRRYFEWTLSMAQRGLTIDAIEAIAGPAVHAAGQTVPMVCCSRTLKRLCPLVVAHCMFAPAGPRS